MTAKLTKGDSALTNSELNTFDSNFELAKAPFVIGVTGHKDACFDDGFDLEDHLVGVFTDWFLWLNDGAKPSSELTSHTPVRVLTGMAAGPDLVAVDAALKAREFLIEEGYPEAAIQIHGILPLPYSVESVDLLSHDYTDDDWKRLQKHVKRLAESPLDQISELKPIDYDNGKSFTENWVKEAPKYNIEVDSVIAQRQLQYLSTGLLISNASSVLIACWDGKVVAGNSTSFLGGTSDVVLAKLGDADRFAQHKDVLRGCIQLLPSSLSGFEPGLVYHIKTARKTNLDRDSHFIPLELSKRPLPCSEYDVNGASGTEGSAGLTPAESDPEVGKYYGLLSNPKLHQDDQKILLSELSEEWCTSLKALKQTNLDIVATLNRLGANQTKREYVRSRDYNPFVDASDQQLPGGGSLPTALLFFASDYTAIQSQSNFRTRALLPYFILVTLGLACWEFYNIFSADRFLYLSLMFLFGLIITRKFASKARWKARYQSHRALAEILRVKGHLNRCNVRNADSLLPRIKRRDFPLHYSMIRLANIGAWTSSIPDLTSKKLTSESARFGKTVRNYSVDQSARQTAKAWIKSQLDFFETRQNESNEVLSLQDLIFKRPNLLLRRIDQISTKLHATAFAVGLIITCNAFAEYGMSPFWELTLLAIIPVLMLATGTLETWASVTSLAQVNNNYSDMHGLLKRAHLYFHLEPNSEKLEDHELLMLEEIGRSALLEHMLWNDAQRQTDVE